MIKLPMIALQNSSDGTFWKQSRVAVVQRDPGIKSPNLRGLVDPNLAVVGVLEPQCGKCKRSRFRNDIPCNVTVSMSRLFGSVPGNSHLETSMCKSAWQSVDTGSLPEWYLFPCFLRRYFITLVSIPNRLWRAYQEGNSQQIHIP
jgi:hypothetical protein